MKIYVSEPIHEAAYRLLLEHAEIIADRSRVGECHAILTRSIKITRDLMTQCPELKVIGVHGVGTDDVDLAAAHELGIRVINVPGANAESVAELIVCFLLDLMRNIPRIDRIVSSGQPLANHGGTIPRGREIGGKTFGLIGCGDIALRAARKLKYGFEMRIIGTSPSLTPEKAEKLGIEYCPDIASVLREADAVNIGCTLTPATRGLIGRKELSLMKPTAVLINTARGPIVDEAALYDALVSGTIAAAACDVFRSEPPTKENPLVGLPNFLATPHIAASTEEALYRVGMGCVEQMLAVLSDKLDETVHFV